MIQPERLEEELRTNLERCDAPERRSHCFASNNVLPHSIGFAMISQGFAMISQSPCLAILPVGARRLIPRSIDVVRCEKEITVKNQNSLMICKQFIRKHLWSLKSDPSSGSERPFRIRDENDLDDARQVVAAPLGGSPPLIATTAAMVVGRVRTGPGERRSVPQWGRGSGPEIISRFLGNTGHSDQCLRPSSGADARGLLLQDQPITLPVASMTCPRSGLILKREDVWIYRTGPGPIDGSLTSL